MRIFFSFLALFITTLSFAQSKGTITGVLTDKDMNNETLPFANVMVKGTTIGATTDEDGKYTLSVPAGTHTVVFSFLGYETETATVTVKAGETVKLNKALGAGSVQIDEVVLTAAVNRQKESALLLEQKSAVEIKQSIGAQEISRKGVSDVATAVTKTSGVTKQEGSGNIFVRGLGDRYNSTSMNGLPVPSNNPDKKNINLNIFSTDIVELVSIDKVYNSKIYGDFGGASIDIVSKDYKGDGFFKIDLGTNFNSNAISNTNFKLQGNYGATGFKTYSAPTNALNTYQFNSLKMESKTPIAGSFGLSGGKSFSVGKEGNLNFFGTASYSNEYNSKKNGSAAGGINPEGVINNRFDTYTSNGYNTNTTILGTVNYRINSANKINYNSVYINTSNQSTDEYTGYIADLANNGNGLIRRSTYVKNTLIVNQLLGEHTFSDRLKTNWGTSYNTVIGDMPDRMQNTLRKEANGYVLSAVSTPDNHRYFQKLTENEVAANINVDYKFKKTTDGYKGKLSVGYNHRYKTRDFNATQFNYKATATHVADIVDPNNLDLFYNQTNYANGYFNMSTFRGGLQVPNATTPQKYNGDQTIQSAYVNTEYKLTSKFLAVVGLRAEKINQNVSWETQLDPVGGTNSLNKNAFLPNLTAKYEVTEKQNLRFGFSKTYTLPQFKERANFLYEDVTTSTIGNPYLYASDNYNLDLKWEMFPKSEEVFSVTVFNKYILNPINETILNSATNDISYTNSGNKGTATGIELEARKLIFNSSEKNTNKLTAGINGSYMESYQDLSNEKVAKETFGKRNVAFTNTSSAFTGASKYLANADLSYTKEWNDGKGNLTSTLAYTYFSDRIYALGSTGRGDLVDKAVGTLDFINRATFNKNLKIGVALKNLTDPRIRRVQANKGGDVYVLSYTKGINFSFDIVYQF